MSVNILLCLYFYIGSVFGIVSYRGGESMKRSDRRYLSAFNLQWHLISHCLLSSLISCSVSLSVSLSLFLTVVVLYIQGIGTKEWKEVSLTIHFSQGRLLWACQKCFILWVRVGMYQEKVNQFFFLMDKESALRWSAEWKISPCMLWLKNSRISFRDVISTNQPLSHTHTHTSGFLRLICTLYNKDYLWRSLQGVSQSQWVSVTTSLYMTSLSSINWLIKELCLHWLFTDTHLPSHYVWKNLFSLIRIRHITTR